MSKPFTDEEIATILLDRKPIRLVDLAKLKAPKGKKNHQHFAASIQITGASGRAYRITARRNQIDPMDFSVILAVVTATGQTNLIRCNGHHGPHPNPIERTVIPADTCHIHQITERYQRIKVSAGERYAEATTAYTTFEGAVDHLAWHFGIFVKDDPYRGGMFRDLE